MVIGNLLLSGVLSVGQAIVTERNGQSGASNTVAEEENARYRHLLREAARSDRLLALEWFEQDRDADAFAHLARACEYDPESTLAAEIAIFRLNVLGVARQVWILHGGSEFPLEPIDRHESIRRHDQGDDLQINEAVFTPDGRQVLTRSDHRAAQLWEAESGRKLQEIREPEPVSGRVDIRGLEVNGSYLAFDQPWEVGIKNHEPIPSPDGTAELARTRHGMVLRHKAKTGAQIQLVPFRGNSNDSRGRFSPDGFSVAIAAPDHRIVLHRARVKHFAQSPERIDPWPATGEEPLDTRSRTRSSDALGFCPGHADTVNQIRFSADSARLVSASGDTTARVWETADRRLLQQFGGLGVDRLQSLKYSPDDRWLIGDTLSGRLLTWDTHTGELLREFSCPGDVGERLASNSDGTIVVIRESAKGLAGTVRLWDSVQNRAMRRLGKLELCVDRADFSPGDKLLATHEENGCVRVWNVEDARQVADAQTTVAKVNLLLFSPDSRYLFVASSSEGHGQHPSLLIDTGTGHVLAKLDIGPADILSASFHPSGTMLATGSNDREARIWECPSGKLMNKLPEHPQTVTSIGFSPDGILLATACWRSTVVQVWSVNDWQRISHIRNPQTHLVEELAFSPDSRLLAASSDRADELVILDARSGETVARIDVPLADYWNASFSHDGKWVFTMCRNDSNTRPSGGPVMLEVPSLPPPVPVWFPDFLRFLMQRKIDGDGHRRVLAPVEWEALRDRVTAAANADGSRYGELARWFLAPADKRPVRPGETMTRHELADRLITPQADPVQLEQALAFDPANPMARLALARFEENPQVARFLRQWATQHLPRVVAADLQKRIDALKAASKDNSPCPPGTQAPP